MKKSLFNLLLLFLPIVTLAQIVEMEDVNIVAECWNSDKIRWHTFQDYKISNLNTNSEYIIMPYYDFTSSLRSEYMNFHIAGHPDLVYVGLEPFTSRPIYRYIGTRWFLLCSSPKWERCCQKTIYGEAQLTFF
ncbi:MAG: hypothetical protein B6I20_14480 [Bacteroidetes bacterium 4572_117]|nr:MAG: hypothetical protein B6I20_14480 [Bacteroidetes bacterium 4572_117]